MLSEEATLYIWSRHADGTPAEKTLRKWNDAYPQEQITMEQIVEFLGQMQARINGGEPAYRARHYILHPETETPPAVTERRLLPHWLRLRREQGVK